MKNNKHLTFTSFQYVHAIKKPLFLLLLDNLLKVVGPDGLQRFLPT